MKLKLMGCVLMLALTGCASFPGNEVAETSIPSMARYMSSAPVCMSISTSIAAMLAMGKRWKCLRLAIC